MIDAGKVLRRAVRDDSAIFEQDDARSEQERFAQVVGDKDNGFIETAREGAKFALKLSARDRIKSAKRLVHQENGRVGGEGTSNADALALSAGELVWASIPVFCRFETNQGKEFVNARCSAGGIPFLEGGDERDVLGHGEMGEKACVLNYIADAASQTDGIPIGGGSASNNDLAGGGHEEAIDQFQERGFAAAAAAQEHEGLAGNDGEADVVNNLTMGTTVETVRNTFKLNNWVRVFSGSFRIHFD